MKTLYDYTINDLRGNKIDLDKFKEKVVLVVNIASKCGFTPQLKGLETIYEKYKAEGFEIIGVPCNQFLFQEPLSGKNISDFCSLNYGVTFQITEKTKVRGFNQHPLFRFLSTKELNGVSNRAPWWNFYKYLIDKNGHLVGYYSSKVSPLDELITSSIENLLKK